MNAAVLQIGVRCIWKLLVTQTGTSRDFMEFQTHPTTFRCTDWRPRAPSRRGNADRRTIDVPARTGGGGFVRQQEIQPVGESGAGKKSAVGPKRKTQEYGSSCPVRQTGISAIRAAEWANRQLTLR